jgi:hypothetical protein
MRRWPLLLCFTLGWATTTYAWAGDGRSEVERIRAAAEEFDSGRRAFTAGDFTTAAEHFENADRDAPAPEALRMAIRARLAAKHYDRVATLAASALARYPDDEPTVTFAKQVLAKVPDRLHRLTIRCNEACTLLVDRKVAPWGESTEAVIYVEPGEHEVAAGWSQGRTKTLSVDAEKGGQTEMTFEAPPLTDEPSPPVKAPEPPKKVDEPTAEPSKGLSPTVFYGAVGLTAVLTGVTVWSTLDMRANPGKDQVREDCAGQDESCPTYQDALSSQKRTNVLLVATGIAAAGTAVLGGFFTDWSDQPEQEASQGSRVVPTISVGQGVFVGANGRF